MVREAVYAHMYVFLDIVRLGAFGRHAWMASNMAESCICSCSVILPLGSASL